MEDNKEADNSPQTETTITKSSPGIGRLILEGLLLVVIPIIAIVFGAQWYEKTGRYVETENAYVKTNVIAISADIDGRVTEVFVDENQLISKGDLLFKLDPNTYAVAIQMAESKRKSGRIFQHCRQSIIKYWRKLKKKRLMQPIKKPMLLTIKGGSTAANVDKKSITTRARLDEAESKLDEAEFELLAANQEVLTRKQKIKTVLARLGGDPNRSFDQHPDFIGAEAELSLAKMNLGYTEVRAPVSGIVTRLKLEPGEWVESGEPAFGIIANNRVWIEANLKETQLTHVVEGQKTTVEVDAYPDVIWEAKVASISPATGAEFSVLPPQNASGNWVKVVQRLPVRIEILSTENKPPLRAGMTSTVSIDTNHQRNLWKNIISFFNEL